MIKTFLPTRQTPVTGKQLLDIWSLLGELPDTMLPLYYKEHSVKTARYALQIAEQLGIPQNQSGELMLAALLHDVGQLGLPLGLLLKQSQPSDEQLALLHDHPRLTEEILKGIPGFENITLWASEHHERMNGRGYHTGKKGFEISVGGRILAIADAFDALTSPRPYRTHAHEALDALPVLNQGRGTQFDGQLVSVLRQVILKREVVSEPTTPNR